MTAVDDAFRWARIHSVRHMAACEQADLRWGETSVTEIVTARAATAVTVVPFTQQAEALSGADWIWWWVDSRGAYGMLVQAKRVTISGGKWKFGFAYPNGTGAQRSALMSAASRLGLLPAYALYLGTGDYRSWERCSGIHQTGRCLQCVKRSVSLMPALLAEALVVDDAASTYQRSAALEDLWSPTPTGALLIPALKNQMAPALLNFLTTRQHGTLAVTRSMIDRVLHARYGQFSAVPIADADVRQHGEHDRLGPIFRNVPEDTGHWGLNYLDHVLSPLLHTPPSYVLEILSGEFVEDSLVPEIPDNVAGVVVVRLHNDG